MEDYVGKIEECLENADLDFPFSVGSYDDEGLTVSVFVDTYEVNEDPVGCMQDITSVVESEFPELESFDTECHEMVVVRFRARQDEDE